MSKIIAQAVARGSRVFVDKAEALLKETIAASGPDAKIEFPDTAFYMPQIYAMTGKKMKVLSDITAFMDDLRDHLAVIPADKMWNPYLGETLDMGMATLFAQEIIMACRYVMGTEPHRCDDGIEYNGFISDTVLRELGVQLVDGSMPGFAVVIGAAATDEIAVKHARELQLRNILTFLCGCNPDGESFAKQLKRNGVELGWDARLVPLGLDTESVIFAADWAARGAMMFGGKTPGNFRDILLYNKARIFAFAGVYGPMSDDRWATGAGAINFGFPAIIDHETEQILPRGVCTYEHVVAQPNSEEFINTCIETRGLKIIVDKIPIPVMFGPAFEGERVRKDDTFLEFGGQKTSAFELVTMREMNEISDNKIELIGTNLDQLKEGGRFPLGIKIEVAGHKMQTDFEPVIERKLHDYINYAQGVWHMGQRNINWIRISKNANAAGFELKHFGDIIINSIKKKFPAIVDKVQVTMFLDEEDVQREEKIALGLYDIRDQRISDMTDESVDTFYSCLLCQSFAPTHVCVVSPERIGLCGAVSWLDSKAAFEIDPTGGNQPVPKGDVIDAKLGRWTGVDEYIWQASRNSMESFNAYSLMESPMTACGCFEVIMAVVPECNGVMLVERGHKGVTPLGMTFSSIAGMVGGGQQTPGFMGVGKFFLTSKKFISAEGGLKRIVWMTTGLKNALREKLQSRCDELGMPDLLNVIADETVTTDPNDLAEHLAKVNHPALTMDSLF